jgi:hypothetical protein
MTGPPIDETYGAEDRDCVRTVPFFKRATIQDCELVPWGSNYTFAVLLEDPEEEFNETIAIYKPAAGEVPLWDFPDDTLYLREYAAYLVAEALGWHFIPTTVIRDGPHGIGSVQEYVEPDKDVHYFTFRDEHRFELQRIAVFDVVTNNADRKAGHCIRAVADGRIWGIDHGLTVNAQPKLRTVIWDFQDEPIDAELLEDLRRIEGDERLLGTLLRYLDPFEVQAFALRIRRVLDTGVFPRLMTRRSIPWGF